MSEPLILKLQNRIKELENKSAITVYSNTEQSFASNTETVVKLTNTLNKKGNDFELQNNELICKKAGYIAINFKILLASGFGDKNNIVTRLYKNNTEQFRSQYRTIGTAMQSFTSETRILEVAANDKINLKIIDYIDNKTIKIGNYASGTSNSINAFYL